MKETAVVDHHASSHPHVTSLFKERSFWLRVLGHMKNDVVATASFLQYLGGILCAVLLGVSLFLLEFAPFKKFVTYIVVIPILIFLTVKYLTILPMISVFLFLFIQPKYAAISLSLISVFSFIWVLMM